MGVLKYDQWYHHWACVLTALQKCKADSDYYYYYYYKLLTYHTDTRLPTTADRDKTGIGFVQEILDSSYQSSEEKTDLLQSTQHHNNTQATSLKVNRERTQRSK